MPTDPNEFCCVIIDKATIAMIDAWSSRSAFEPSRRKAVKVLLRVGLKQVNRPKATTAQATAPVMEQPVS
jgi:hypothetical protein